MDAVSNRLKTFGFSKRKNSVNNQTTNHLTPTSTNGIASTPPQNSSQTSLPMNQQPNPAGRPPSYSYNNAAGRPTSPMPPGQTQLAHHPPPIDTTQRFPASSPAMGPPQPPGYGGYAAHPQQVGAPHTVNQYTRPAEVDGGGRSKAQLIVGIDFVRIMSCFLRATTADCSLAGYHIFRSCIRICDQHRGKRGHHYRMAWSR
jgi:hypothetical protein